MRIGRYLPTNTRIGREIGKPICELYQYAYADCASSTSMHIRIVQALPVCVCGLDKIPIWVLRLIEADGQSRGSLLRALRVVSGDGTRVKVVEGSDISWGAVSRIKQNGTRLRRYVFVLES